MKSYEHLIVGGPSIHAWPTSKSGKLRPGNGGGGGGDGGAAEMEQQRQARQRAAIDTINRIFNGQDVLVGDSVASAYQPGQVYYNADGSLYTPPTVTKSERIDTASRAPNVFGNGGDQGASYYDITQDPSMGSWRGGGDAGESWRPNSGVYERTSGGDADMSMGFYQDVSAPDTDAINAAINNGSLYTGTRMIKGYNRQKLYDDQKAAVTELNQREVKRQEELAERQNRFGLARAGLSGGSSDIESNAEIDRLRNEGLMKAVGIGQSAAADLRSQDERTRQSLIGMAQSGIDTGQVSQMALAGLDSNTAAAQSARQGATIGNVFSDLAQAYLFNQQQQAFQQAMNPYANKDKNSLQSTRITYTGQVN